MLQVCVCVVQGVCLLNSCVTMWVRPVTVYHNVRVWHLHLQLLPPSLIYLVNQQFTQEVLVLGLIPPCWCWC